MEPAEASGVRRRYRDGLGCLVLLAFIGALFYAERIRDLFRLDGSDTIYDYHTADIEEQVRFFVDACNSGACITETDWACGFEFSRTEAFDSCFKLVLENAKPWVTLDLARKYCGREIMEFSGTLYGDPAKCQKKGGTWAQKFPGPELDF